MHNSLHLQITHTLIHANNNHWQSEAIFGAHQLITNKCHIKIQGSNRSCWEVNLQQKNLIMTTNKKFTDSLVHQILHHLVYGYVLIPLILHYHSQQFLFNIMSCYTYICPPGLYFELLYTWRCYYDAIIGPNGFQLDNPSSAADLQYTYHSSHYFNL